MTSCSNVAQLSTPQPLSTQIVGKQYYYCESCHKVTPLYSDVYEPLEPDTPALDTVPSVPKPSAPTLPQTVVTHSKSIYSNCHHGSKITHRTKNNNCAYHHCGCYHYYRSNNQTCTNNCSHNCTNYHNCLNHRVKHILKHRKPKTCIQWR